MKVLAVADIHSREKCIRIIQEEAERHKPDVIVVAGDITSYGPKEEVKRVLESLSGRVLAIPGNLDLPNTSKAIAESRAESLASSPVVIGGVTFATLQQGLEACHVLVVHEPPYGTLDDVGGGRHIGNHAVNRAIETLKPWLVICGHVHESPGVAKLGETLVVNCTMGRKGRGALIEVLEGKVQAQLL